MTGVPARFARVIARMAAKVLGIVLAGGEGKRLWPLTADRAKPAVPFGGNYRLIDFVLSNLVNAGMHRDLRAHAVQVALAGPAHHHDLADVQRARQLRHPGAGAAAARPALVHRQRRRDLPVAEPGLRREARLHRGVRRRPRVPDGPVADGRGSTSRPARASPWPASGCRAPRRPRSACIDSDDDRPDHRVPGEAGRPAVGAGRPGRHLRVDGQLRLHHRRADRGAARPTPRTATPTTTWAATSSRAWSSEGDAHVYDFADNDVPGATERDRGYWRDVGTIDAYYDAHMDLVSVHPIFNLYNQRWPIRTPRRRCRRRSSSRAASRRTRSSARARSSPGRPSAVR